MNTNTAEAILRLSFAIHVVIYCQTAYIESRYLHLSGYPIYLLQYNPLHISNAAFFS